MGQKMGHFRMLTGMHVSVAEPPLFWAAPAPDVRGPVADSGSRQKKRLWLQTKKGGSWRLRLRLLTLIFLISALKSAIIKVSFFDHISRPPVTLAILMGP